MVAPESFYVRIDGQAVHALRAGRGDRTLFLFHETPLSGMSFLPAIGLLQHHFRVIALDTPGYGASDPPSQPARMEDYAAILWQAMQATYPGPFAMAGIHTGASLCLEIARAHPEAPLTGLVLSGIPCLDPAQQETLRQRIRARAGKTDEETLLQGWRGRAQRWYRAPPDLLIQAFADELRVFERRDWALQAVMGYDPAPALEALRVPALLLNGEHDSLGKSDRETARRYPKLEARLLPEWGGQLPWTAGEVYARHVIAFLAAKFPA